MLQLEFPNISHEKAYKEMIEEWRNFETIPTSPGRLFAGNSFEEFLEIIQNDVSNNPNGVNSHLFFLVENKRIL